VDAHRAKELLLASRPINLMAYDVASAKRYSEEFTAKVKRPIVVLASNWINEVMDSGNLVRPDAHTASIPLDYEGSLLIRADARSVFDFSWEDEVPMASTKRKTVLAQSAAQLDDIDEVDSIFRMDRDTSAKNGGVRVTTQKKSRAGRFTAEEKEIMFRWALVRTHYLRYA
jgi:hypothetical protein